MAGTTLDTGPFSFVVTHGYRFPRSSTRPTSGAQLAGGVTGRARRRAPPPGPDSALDGTGEAADDAALEQREEHQRRDHRQRREREHPGGVHGVLRRERLDAEGQRVRRLVVEDEQRQYVAVPARDERQDAGRHPVSYTHLTL